MNYQDLQRLSSEQIAHYASVLSFNYNDSNYIHNLQAPGQSYDDHCAISKEIARRNRLAAIEAFETTPAIKTMLLSKLTEHGSQKPEAVDYTQFFQRALDAKHTAFGKPQPAYKPEPVNGKIKMLPAKAVSFYYSQQSYSDDSAVAVPFEGEGDLKAFGRNVSTLVRRANSHNGFAGSGCTYEASVCDGYVVIHCRASTSD